MTSNLAAVAIDSEHVGEVVLRGEEYPLDTNSLLLTNKGRGCHLSFPP